MGNTKILGNYKVVKDLVIVIFTFFVLFVGLPVGLYYLYSPGGYYAKQKAVKSVQGVNISIMISNTKENYTLEKLIREYDFEKKTLPIANTSTSGGQGGSADISVARLAQSALKGVNDLNDALADDLPWEAQYIGRRKFVVGCRYHGHLISFETDTINVTPKSDEAKDIYNLK
ncbi:MAG: hypothetical protein WCJ56_07255 [bacterium]